MNSFDLLRLLAAVAVIAHHARGLSGRAPWTIGATDLGGLGVAVFFVISGYLIAASWKRSAGLGDFLKKRLLRIEPGLIASLLVTAVVLGAFATSLPLGDYFTRPGVYLYVLRDALLYPVTYALPGVFAHTPFPNAVNGSLWTLRLEFTCYLGVAALGMTKLLKAPVVGGLVGLAALTALAFALRPDLGHGDLPRRLLIGAQFGFLFLAGALIQLIGRRPPLWTVGFLVLLATPMWILGLPLAVIAVGEMRSVRLPADLSYGLYIYAFPLQQMLAQHGMLGFWSSLAVTAPFAAASWFLVEKPALRLKAKSSKASEK